MTTSDELIRRIGGLSDKQRRALTAMLTKAGVDLSGLYDGITAVPRSKPIPLSFTQQRLWFLNRLDGPSAAYNIPMAVRLTGHLDRSALRRALTTVVGRHEVLRTRFVERDGVPFQDIGDGDDFVVAEQDVTRADLRLVCTREAATPFDLERGPLIRARLLRESEQQHVLLVTMHHSVSDGWSVGVFVRDTVALYEAFRAGRPSPLEPLPVQYADFAHWQRNWLTGETQARQVEYWRNQLSGVDQSLSLPVDRARPAVKTYNGARESFRCSAELLDALRELSANNGVTLYMTVLAAYAMVLHRYNDRTDIAIGTVVANRTRRELENLVGFFANTVVMRVDLDDDPAFPELLARVKKTALGAYEHQDVPFEAVVDALRLERVPDRSPVFQTMLVLQEAQTEREVELDGLRVSTLDVGVDFTKFDTTVDLRETPDGLAGTVEYNTDLFDRETIRRFVGHFTHLLADIVARPDAPVSLLDVADETERRLVVETWNDTARPYSADRCLHELFEDAVRRHPDRIALVDEARQWTYAELDAWANGIGHELRDHGVGPDTVVGLHLRRSAELVAGIYGTLKAGGAYLPIEPTYPDARIAELVDGSGVQIVLTGTGSAALGGAAHVLRVDPHVRADDPPTVDTGPANLAYVIHTSGSTGRPKGVMIEHRAAVNRIEWMQNEYRLTADDVVLQKTPVSFDVSVWEFFWPLLFGARLVLAEADGHKDPAYLVSAIQRFGVTTLHFVPSMFRTVVADPGWARCTSVRQVFCSGEALPPDLCASHYERHSAPLHNLYGPTEAAVDVSHWTCPPRTPRIVPIGRPIQNIQLYVLNEAMRPQGIGCVGQLYIAGTGLARGYLHQPDLTRERFVPNPFTPGTRMYRTGDLARWLPDGTVEYLGRVDDQVKLRGFRIELGEIEHRLSRHPAVRSCAVVVREDQPGNPRLVAYPVVDGEVSVADLAAHLALSLPDHMVPTAFVVVPSLPVTRHGKLDREALPAPGMAAFAQRAYTAPSTGTEQLLAKVWAELLGLDEQRIGADDNFFSLGGHSLLITVLLARLTELGLHADVRAVFSTPTLSGLAALLDKTGAGPAFTVPPNRIPAGCDRITPEMLTLIDLGQEQIDSIVATVPGGAANVQDIYPLLSTQEGILFHHLLDPDNDPYLVSTLYVADDEATCARFVDALQAVVDRHDVMRTAVLTTGLPDPVQVVHRSARLTVRRTRLDGAGDAEQQARALLERPDRMALDQAPLLRLVVAEDPASERRYLVVNAHHLVEDATSLRLTLGELATHISGRAHRLAPAPPYRDFVAHTLGRLSSEQVAEYFRAMLGDVTEPTTPFGLTNVRGDARRVRQSRHTLPAWLTDRIRAQAQRMGISPACLFHAAWACVVAACSGRDDVVFGTVMSGRLQGVPGIERMLGNFINTLPMRVRLAGKSVCDLVADVSADLRELAVHEQSPLSMVQRCSGLDGDAPLFNAVANFRHFEPGHGDAATMFDGIGVRFLGAADGINYPLSVSLDDFGTELSLDIQVDDTVSVAAIAGYVETALSGIVDALADDDGAGVAALDIDVLPESERTRLVVEWNDTAAELPHPTLMAAFEAQVRRTPDHVALKFGADTVSYTEFNARANQLAHWLIERGAGPDVLVAVRLPRSFDLMVAIYGVLKSGAAYLPVDTELPADRVEQMLSDGNPMLVLDELPATTGHPRTDPGVAVHADNIAYVLYTSGTTGTPKGVVITHRASMNWIGWDQDFYRMQVGDRSLFKTSVSFDVSVKELFWPLQEGGTVVIARPGGHRDPEYLAQLIKDERITDADFVPSMLAAFLSEPAAADCTSLRWVEATGEALPVELAERFTRALPTTRLSNICGPTEVGGALGCEFHPEPGATRVPIGAPVLNTRAYVLDPALRPMPQGVAGELYIGGAQVARGFLNKPGMTAERFIPDPFVPGERMYRTGDLVRWRPDGLIEHLGRLDDQLKIRGFRVEPGEIASVLHTHPSVRSAVVVPRTSGHTRSLVAYVSPLPDWLETASREQNAEHVERWRQFFDGRHAEGHTVRPGESTVRRIERFRPKRVLEIGCGAGELLVHYAGECESVHAVDLSAVAVDRARTEADGRGWSHVTVGQGEATSVAELVAGPFDLVVLNSVVRHFPNRGHLEQAIASVLPLLVDGGRILVSDVPNADVYPALQCAVELGHAAGGVPAGELAGRLQRVRRQETELLVSPTYFARLTETVAEIGAVDVVVDHAGRGAEAYRYDVVLTKGAAVSAGSYPWLTATTPAELRAVLAGDVPDVFGVSGLVNPAITGDVEVVEGLARWAPGHVVHPVRGRDENGFDAVVHHAGTLGYRVAVTWSQDRLDGLDLVFSRGELPPVLARSPYRATRLTNAPQLGPMSPAITRMLKDHLSTRLPEYMVPGVFVVLEELPVTRNGKVDKRALPPPNEDDLTKEAHVEPRSDAERALCRMLAELLDVGRVGLRDTFFDLGGHSLLATRLTLRVRKELGAELPLQLIFTNATVEELAAALETTTPGAGPVLSTEDGEMAPLSLQQSDLWFLDRPEHLESSYDNVQLAFRLDGELDRDAFAAAVRALVERHAILRTSYPERDGGHLQRVNGFSGYDVPVQPVGADEVARWLEVERRRPFQPDDHHMLRVRLLALSRHEHIAVLTRPWGVFDGWSVHIVLGELMALYRGATLAPVSMRYSDFARWQRKAVDSAELRRQLGYWERQLAGLPARVSLRTDRPRGAVKTYQGSTVDFTVPSDVLGDLQRLSQECGATLYMTLLSAFAVVVGGHTDDEELAIGTAVTNRPRSELDQVVGYFVNTLVLRLDVAGNRSFTDLLVRARQVTASAHEHKDVPFADVVRALVPDRDPACSPLFQVMFNMLPTATDDGDDGSGDLVVTPVRNHAGTAKFDLNLVVREAENALSGYLEYAEDLFDTHTAERMVRSYERLLHAVVTDPGADLVRLRAMANGESR